jgi:hypothetical protein
MRAGALLIGLSAVACATETSSVRKLQELVLAGVNSDYQDECWAGPIWAVVDDASAGERLDRMLQSVSGYDKPSLRESVCGEDLARARLVRLLRLGAADLKAELRHPSPLARAAAERYLAEKAGRRRAAAEADPNCESLRLDLASEDERRETAALLMLVADRFRPFRRAATTTTTPSAGKVACAIDPDRRDRILADDQHRGPRALLAAALLWEHHPDPLGGAPTVWRPIEPMRGLEPAATASVRAGTAIACRTDLDCSFPTRCIRPEGAATKEGVCGELVDNRSLRPVSAGTTATACVRDAQCPSFAGCKMLDVGAGVCVMR